MSHTAIATGYQTLPLTIIDESPTNPRRTFDPDKLAELAQSIREHGLIQPITVRPKGEERFEIVAGARRFRAAQLAEMESIGAIVHDLTAAQALEAQLIENAQRQDVHPYEEAAGYQRVLELPGYDVAALALTTGKSQSHIYARLTLLNLIPSVAEAFQHDRITASHANLIARLADHEVQAEAFKQCWRKDWQDKEPHLLPAKHLAAWIQDNLYLALDEAPFPTDDPALRPEAGACVTCPRRSGFNTQLFADVKGDQCFDSACYQAKTSLYIDRELVANPNLIQIDTTYRNPKERGKTVLGPMDFRELETPENTDAEPPCEATRTAIVVYGKHVGKQLSVCVERDCPVHDPRQVEERKANPVPVMEPPAPEETEEEAEARKAEHARRQEEYRAEQQRREDQRREEQEKADKEHEAEVERRDNLRKQRERTFERILATDVSVLTPRQFRVILRALINMDPYAFADDLAAELSEDPDNDRRSAEEVLTTTVHSLTDDKLTGFLVHLALAGHRDIPRADELDILSEAEAVFLTRTPAKAPKPTKPAKAAKKEAKAPVKAPAKAAAKGKATPAPASKDNGNKAAPKPANA